MTTINVKMDLIRMDMVVKDILRIYEGVPSPYLFPKAELAKSRALVRTDVKKALKIARKALTIFQEESVIATRYNAIKDSILLSGETLRIQNNDYLKLVSQGDYDEAGKVLDDLSSKIKGAYLEYKVTVSLSSSDEAGSVLCVSNQADFHSIVSDFTVTKDSDSVKTDPGHTFTVPPKSERMVKVSALPPFHISARYQIGGEEKSISEDL